MNEEMEIETSNLRDTMRRLNLFPKKILSFKEIVAEFIKVTMASTPFEDLDKGSALNTLIESVKDEKK